MIQFHVLLVLLRGTNYKVLKFYNATLRILPYMMESPCSSFQYYCKARNRHDTTHKHAVVFKVTTAYILEIHDDHFGET